MAFVFNNLATGLQWERLKPNLRLVENFNGRRCGILWDGFRFPIKSINGSLAGQELEGFTFPIVFGYNDYFILDSTVETDERDFSGQLISKAVNLWCGEIFSAAFYGFSDSGAAGIFRETPNSALTFLNMMLSPRLVGVLMGMSPLVFEFLPHFKRGGFFLEIESGHMITRKQYFRREFAFLDSFTGGSWAAIWITLLSLSMVTSLVGQRIFRAMRRKSRGSAPLLEKFLVGWLRVALEFVGLMLGEPSAEIQSYSRPLVGLWLLAATMLGGCLSSSLRGLLAKAGVVCWPETWQDLLADPFRHLTLVSSRMLPSWQDFPRVMGDETVDQLIESGRLKLIGLIQDIVQYILEPAGCFDLITNILTRLDRYVILAFKRIIMVVLWGMTLCENPLAQALAFMYNGFQSNFTQDQLDYSYHKIQAVRSEFYQHGAISPGRGTIHWYFPYAAQANPTAVRWFDRYLVRLRDFGIMFIADELTDCKLTEKFMRHTQVQSDCDKLKIVDLIGPFITFGLLLLLALLVSGLEKFLRRKTSRSRVAPAKIAATHTGTGGGPAEDFSPSVLPQNF